MERMGGGTACWSRGCGGIERERALSTRKGEEWCLRVFEVWSFGGAYRHRV